MIICADDYACSERISLGILALARVQHINAISCLVTQPAWSNCHQALTEVKTNCLIGLHLDFTEGCAQSRAWQAQYGYQFNGLAALMRAVYCRRIPVQIVRAEISAQMDFFTKAMGKKPDFIDGHQYVHQFPLIFDALCQIYHSENNTYFIRNTYNHLRDLWKPTGFPKHLALTLLGGYRCKRRLNQAKIPTNTSFAGIYPFKHAAHYKTYFQRFLQYTKPDGLIVCHPGLWDSNSLDPIKRSRFFEYEYLINNNHLSATRQR